MTRLSSRYAAWGLADQMLSSASNFLASLAVAHVSAPKQYGIYAIVMTIYVLSLAALRSGIGQPLLIVAGEDVEGNLAAQCAAALGGVIPAFAVMIFALTVGRSLFAGEVVFACALPALMVQDVYRYGVIARGASRQALLADLVWVIVELVGFVVLFVSQHATASTVMGTWAGAGAVSAAVVTARRVRSWRVVSVVSWMRRHATLGRALVGEAGLVAVAGQFTIVGLGVTGGTSAIAALKAGQLLLGPLLSINLGLSVLLVPMAHRWLGGDCLSRALHRSLQAVGTVLIITAGYSTALLLVPDGVGVRVLGANWKPARELLPALVVAQLALGVIVVMGSLLRARGDGRGVFQTRLKTAALEPGLGTIGALWRGAGGAADGIAVAAWLSCLVWVLAGRRSVMAAFSKREGSGVVR